MTSSNERPYRRLRSVAALLLVVSATNHARLALAGDPSVPRHVLFVAINLALAVMLVRFPRYALVATSVLLLQQMTSHGSDLVRSMRGPGPLDLASLAVCLFFPALVTVLVLERRAARRQPRDPKKRASPNE